MRAKSSSHANPTTLEEECTAGLSLDSSEPSLQLIPTGGTNFEHTIEVINPYNDMQITLSVSHSSEPSITNDVSFKVLVPSLASCTPRMEMVFSDSLSVDLDAHEQTLLLGSDMSLNFPQLTSNPASGTCPLSYSMESDDRWLLT